MIYYTKFNDDSIIKVIKEYLSDQEIYDMKDKIQTTILQTTKIIHKLYQMNNRRGLDSNFYFKLPKSITYFFKTMKDYYRKNQIDESINVIYDIVKNNLNLYYSLECQMPFVCDLALNYYINIY